jgi:O-antigen/teichoic acid export membrane protein
MTNVEEISPPIPSLSRRAGIGMLWSQAGRVAEVAITFGTAVLVVRGLNPTNFGTYSLLTNLAGAASVFIPVVTTESLGAVFPRLGSRKERVFMTAGVALLRALILLTAAAVTLGIWNHVASAIGIPGAPRSLALLTAGYWLAQDMLNMVVGFYGAELDMRPVAIWRTTGLAATFLAVLVLAVTDQFTVGRVLAVVSSGYALALAGLVVGLRKTGRPKSPPSADIRYALGLTKSVWLIAVLSFTLATQVDILLIGALTHDRRQAAFYAAAVGVVLRVQLLLVSGWAALIIPTFGHALSTGGIPRLRRAWRRSAQLWLLVSLPLNALLLANAQAVIGLLFGTPYLVSTRLLEWVCAFNLGAALFANPSCIGALWAADKQPLLARFRVVSAALNIGLAFALIPPYGALGAVIATGVAAVGGSAVEFELSRRLGVNDYPYRVALTTVVAAMLAMVPGLVINPAESRQLAASGVLGVLLFFGVLVVARPLTGADALAATAVHPRLGRLALRLFVRQ